MKYLQFIWADGRPSKEDIATMNREFPAFDEEMEARGVRVLGRELQLPATAASVRVRDGETVVSDGPFAETKEFIAGFDVLDCADLDEAIEVTAKCPIARFHPLELRPFLDELRLTETVSAFGRSEDGGARPFLLATWASVNPFDDPAMVDEVAAWRQDLTAREMYVLGSALGENDLATTVRVRDGETVVSARSFSRIDAVVTAVEVVNCAEREQAITLAAAYPLARDQAIEVRPFYQE